MRVVAYGIAILFVLWALTRPTPGDAYRDYWQDVPTGTDTTYPRGYDPQ